MSTAIQASTEMRPFQVDIPDDKVDDLRRRIAAARWPSKEREPNPRRLVK